MRAKRITAALAAGICAASIAGCGGTGTKTAASGTGASGTATGASGAGTGSSAATTGSDNRGLPQTREPVTLDPKDFTTTITNPYWPMAPGARWVFSETSTAGERQRTVVTVTNRIKKVANGISARVITDVATENGKPVEVTEDWYAQDSKGNLWYLGEQVANYKNGKLVSRSGSWEAGADGAQPGIALPGDPAPGLAYRQEYYAGEAEDRGAVVTVGMEKVEVPFGFFPNRVLMTRDTSPIEPKVQELKFYAPNVGPILSVHLDGDGGRAELVSYTSGR